MSQVFDTRLDWDIYFLRLAKTTALRADCRRARHGAVIVKDHRVVSMGYNGSPAGGPSCLAGECPRGLLTYSQAPTGAGGPGQDYSNCVACHAELNAVVYGNREDMKESTIYVTGASCDGCKKAIAAAGIETVIWSVDMDSIIYESVAGWLKDWSNR